MKSTKKALLRELARKAAAKAAPVCAKCVAVYRSSLVAMALTLPAFASDNTSSLTSVVSATDTVASLVNKVFSIMTGNGLLTVYLAFGLLGAAIRVFKKMKRAAR